MIKEVKAYIKTHKLDAVIRALNKIENLPGMSVSDVRGCGHRHADGGKDRRMDELVHHARLEVVCRDDQVERVVKAIQEAAHTGLHGDGKIYVSTIDDAVRIETGVRGEAAV